MLRIVKKHTNSKPVIMKYLGSAICNSYYFSSQKLHIFQKFEEERKIREEKQRKAEEMKNKIQDELLKIKVGNKFLQIRQKYAKIKVI